MKAKTVYLRKLRKVAAQLNDCLGLQPPIPLYSPREELEQLCKEAAKLVVAEDTFSRVVRRWLEEEAGVSVWPVPLAVIDYDVSEERKKPGPKPKPKIYKMKKRPGPKRKVGRPGKIMNYILEIITEAGEEGISRDECWGKLCRKFSDRPPQSLYRTMMMSAGGKRGGKLSLREGVELRYYKGRFYRIMD